MLTKEIEDTHHADIVEFGKHYLHVLEFTRLMGKSIQEWTDYFNIVAIPNPDIYQIREQLADVTNKIMKCQELLSQIRYSHKDYVLQTELAINVRKAEILEKKENGVTKTLHAKMIAEKDNADSLRICQLGDQMTEYFQSYLITLKAVAENLRVQSQNVVGEAKAMANLYVNG